MKSQYSQRTDEERAKERAAYQLRKAFNLKMRSTKRLLNQIIRDAHKQASLEADLFKRNKPPRRRHKWVPPGQRKLSSLECCKKHKWFQKEVKEDM